MQLPDGVVPQIHAQINAYDRYQTPYMTPENDTYSVHHNYAFPATSKQEDNYGYQTPYTPAQYASQIPDNGQQIYSNPYYSATHNNTTIVTDSPIPSFSNNQPNTSQYSNIPTNMSQPNVNPNHYAYDPYSQNNTASTATPIPEVASPMYNQKELNTSFSQMQVGTPKPDPPNNFGNEYTHTYFSVQYPQANTPNSATYSHSNSSTTNMVPSQTPSEYNSINYPYSSDAQFGQNSNANPVYSTPDPQYFATNSYANASQGYPIYTNADSGVTSTSSMSNVNASTSQPYTFPEGEQSYVNSSLSHIDSLDKPIKSHAKGEALSTFQPTYPVYDSTVPSVPSSQIQATSDHNFQNTQPKTYGYNDQSNVNYQGYQNHPGYTFNTATGAYEYTYGSQNSFSSEMNVNPQGTSQDPNWHAQGVYTSAGSCDMVQSTSENPQQPDQAANNQIYYNAPYGYITNTNQSTQMVPETQPSSTNYGANMNQSTYMQSGQGHDTSVTYASNQGNSLI